MNEKQISRPRHSARWRTARPRAVFGVVLAVMASCGLALDAAPARAADEVLGEFRDWFAVAYDDGGKKVCYAVSKPKKSDGDYTKRGPIYVQVTRRGGASGDVVSFEAGYPYKDGGEVEVTVKKKTFTLFADRQTAWAYTADDDRALVKAMRKGSKMTVVGFSRRGTKTTDTYSLYGFTLAHKAIVKACG